jgi:hypothetical protein
MTRARPAAVESPELASIRAQLLHLERLEAQIDAARRELQARRAAILEDQEGLICH